MDNQNDININFTLQNLLVCIGTNQVKFHLNLEP